MNTSTLADINQGLQTAYIDSSINSSLAYRPEFISNDYRRGKKVLTTIEQELYHCDEFSISVAFITLGGITPLLQVLKELENRNIPGKILTTDYLMFSDSRAQKKLHELKNIQLRMYHATDEDGGFHTKGYIFSNWIGLEDAAIYMSVTKDTVRNWIKKTDIPVHKIGKLWKFKRFELDEWIKSGKNAM